MKLEYYIYVSTAMSVLTFAMYAIDKHQARQTKRRIGESVLHVCELLGGWPGGFAGRLVWRHKTRKVPFLIISWLIVAAHAALIVWGIQQ